MKGIVTREGRLILDAPDFSDETNATVIK